MSRSSNTKCEICLQKGIRSNVRTLCNECRQFLCKECSDTHLHDTSPLNQSLTEMNPPGEESKSANEDDLASDFREHATISDTVDLHHPRIAMQSDFQYSEYKELTNKSEAESKQGIDIDKQKATKFHEFSVKQSDDAEYVRVSGILTFDDVIVIADCENKKLKLFDRSGTHLYSTDVEQYPWGITRVDNNKFATCGSHGNVFIWTLCGFPITEKEKYHVDYENTHVISYIHKMYFCVLHRFDNAISILDSQGRRVRRISKTESLGNKFGFGWDIHMDTDTYNIYVPSWPNNGGVLCLSVEGETLWFTPLPKTWLRGITEIDGTLCVDDSYQQEQCLHLISKDGKYMRKLLGKEELDGEPEYIFYYERDHRLYVSYATFDKNDIISVYSL